MGSLKKVAYPAEVDPTKIILSKACLLQAGRTRHMKKDSAVPVEKPIESTFAMVRLRTAKTRDCVSRATILAIVFKLKQSAKKEMAEV
jgi:hypothetical protein